MNVKPVLLMSTYYKDSENTHTLILNKYENVIRTILKEEAQGHLNLIPLIS